MRFQNKEKVKTDNPQEVKKKILEERSVPKLNIIPSTSIYKKVQEQHNKRPGVGILTSSS